MISTNALERWKFSAKPQCSGVFDSAYDLERPSGARNSMPSITLPDVVTTTGFFQPLFRVAFPCAVNRFSLYLTATNMITRVTKPFPFTMSIQVGIDCLEDYATTAPFLVTPPSFEDGGVLLSIATRQLWTSLVVGGFTQGALVTDIESVVLRVIAMSSDCCSETPTYGPMVSGT